MSEGRMAGNFLPVAMGYAERGWHVFPLGVGSKIPLISKSDGGKWHSDATTDPEIIRGWWTRTPGANIGIATGGRSGFWALDLDPRHGGDEAFKALQAEHGGVGETVTAKTGGGGWHLYFHHAPNVRNSAGTVGPGIDVRGEGGYVVAPPSIRTYHTGGSCYSWVKGRGPGDIDIQPAPLWLLMAAQRAGQNAVGGVARPEWYRDLFASGVDEGSRNTAVTRMAGHLIRKLDPLLALDILKLWNRERVRPPLDERELIGIVNSVCGREYRRTAR